MTQIDTKYGPLYRAAARQGISPAMLDLSRPHVVRMMLIDPDAEESHVETESEFRQRVAEVIAARDEGREPDHEPFDMAMLGG